MTTILIFLATPLDKRYQAEKINDSSYYFMALDAKNSTLYAVDSSAKGLIDKYNLKNMKMETIFQAGSNKNKKTKLAEYLYYHNDRLFFIDRSRQSICAYDTKNLNIIKSTYQKKLDDGDSWIIHIKNKILVLLENRVELLLFDNNLNFLGTKTINAEQEGMCIVYNKYHNSIYVTNWFSLNKKYCIYELTIDTFKTINQINLSGPLYSRLLLTDSGEKLYIPQPMHKPIYLKSYIFVINPENNNIIEKIPVTLGLKDFAIDEENGLLVTADSLTNLIEVIDLRTKKIKKTFRAGKYYLRTIALDKKEGTCYITTEHSGFYKFNYL